MLKLQDGFHFQNSFRHLPHFLYEDVDPDPIEAPTLIHVTHLQEEIGLKHLTDFELRTWLNGESRILGDQRISTRYAGHQFGVWAGQLGDGRAISLGEICSPQGERFEIQIKGLGTTPFSRMGDGRAVIRSSVREYLCSEAMHGLGIPTTRVLALLTGQDAVQRETIERSATVARVFPSNLRFGHFEMCYHFEKNEELKALIEYARHTFFNGLAVSEMLKTIVERTARLMAQWQSVGFCHGVMNSDNMSLLGITIDYGPFGFMEDTVLNFVCNHSDTYGRYAYDQQPSIAMWNLERLFVCFLDFVPREELQSLLNSYPKYFEHEYLQQSRKKLGLNVEDSGDSQLFIELMRALGTLNIDYTFFYRQLSQYIPGDKQSLKALWDYYGDRQEIIEWLAKYSERLKLEKVSNENRHQQMKIVNPKYVLKNYIAQEVIKDVEEGRDHKLKAWLEILAKPYDEHPKFHAYSAPTPSEHKNIEVSCSS